MPNFYCVYCGLNFSTVKALVSLRCSRSPDHGNHKLYEGSEKSQYTCKYCGLKFTKIRIMTGLKCTKHPAGSCKGFHSPAL